MASPLMRIPGELRLMIYEYLFDAGDPVPSFEGQNGNNNIVEHESPNGEEGEVEKMEAKKRVRKSATGVAQKTISIRNCQIDSEEQNWPGPTRARYRVLDHRTAHFRMFEATYALANGELQEKRKRKKNTATTTTSTSTSTCDSPSSPTSTSTERLSSPESDLHAAEVRTPYFCTPLMRTCRTLWAETAHFLYAGHTFDFGADVQAVGPFLSSLTPATRDLVTQISVYKRGPWFFDRMSDRDEWRAMCTYLRHHAAVEHLRLVIQGARLRGTWKDVVAREEAKRVDTAHLDLDQDQHHRHREQGCEFARDGPPQPLSSAQVSLLLHIRHEAVEWIDELVRVVQGNGGMKKKKKLRSLEVVPDFSVPVQPDTVNTWLYLVLSESIGTGLGEFLRERMVEGF